MQPRTEKDFWIEMSIREISTQAHFAHLSYRNINPKAVANNDLVFSSIHSFLSHCAMVSKMLLANDGATPPRSIGDVLGVPEASVIHNRRFRNHLEHYDERLKDWIASRGMDANVGTYNIGPKTAFNVPGMVIVSHYDPTLDVFTFVDEDFDLGDLHSESERIKTLADQWVANLQTRGVTPSSV